MSASVATGATERAVVHRFKSRKMKEGAGFVVRRPIGVPELPDTLADPVRRAVHLSISFFVN